MPHRRTAIVSVHQLRDINMVPMIDVMMFLLVVFIITMPLIEQGIPVNLPRGQAESLDFEKTRSITMNMQGQLFLDDVTISKEDLNKEMQMLGQTEPDATVLVRADEGIPYGRVVEVMKILHDARLARLGLVTAAEATPTP